MSSAATIGLIAGRELRERGRSKAFLISTLVIVALSIALATLPSLLNHPTQAHVGVIGAVPAGFEPALDAVVKTSGADATVTVQSYEDEAAGRAALQAGTVEVLFVPASERLIWPEDPNPQLDTQLRQASAAVHVQEQAQALGLSSQQLAQVVQPPALANDSLRTVDPDRGTKVGVALAGTIVLFMAINTAGGFVLSGVIEEKTTRIVEVLLAQVRPHQLLAGKVLGIGALALVQLFAIGASSLTAGLVVGTIPTVSVAVGALVSVIFWFVLGFAFYAVLYAAAGSLVNRQEEAQSVTFPVLVPLLAAYFLSFATLATPDLALSRWLSMFPPTAPVLMPLRMQLGVATPIEVIVAVVLTVVAVYGLIRLGGRVYAGAILRSGGRVKVRDAFAAGNDVIAG
jgi:ABC-2 type transport system permease protein